jgi:hypothetical protein
MMISLLLFSTHTALLLLLSSVCSHLSSLLKLLNKLLLLDLLIKQLLLPLIIDFAFSELPGLFLHAVLLLLGFFFQVQVFEAHVLIIHQLALLPFLQPLPIILRFVATQVVLNGSSLLKGKLVETEFKVYQVSINACSLNPFVSASLIHLAVSQIKTDKSLVSLHALDKEEKLWDCRLLCVWFEWCIFILENIIAL